MTASFVFTMATPLSNYIRSYRKRSGLTQDEVAYVVGLLNDSSVTRMESGKRLPDLKTAFALEVLFGVSARELFPGMFLKIENRTIDRIGVLAATLMKNPKDPFHAHKLDSLARAVRESSLRSGPDEAPS